MDFGALMGFGLLTLVLALIVCVATKVGKFGLCLLAIALVAIISLSEKISKLEKEITELRKGFPANQTEIKQ